MRHVIIEIIKAAYRRIRLSEPLCRVVQNIRRTSAQGTSRPGKQAEAEHRARLQKAKHDGEATSAVIPYRLIR